MIPVWQTRYAAETFGNCLEACLATLLELPLAAVPDRAVHVDGDRWADLIQTARRQGVDIGGLEPPDEYLAGERDLQAWLADRGLVMLDIDLDGRGHVREWLSYADDLDLRWIGHVAGDDETAHATVWRGARCVHNPTRGAPTSGLGRLLAVTVLVASEPARLARLDPLPDVVGALDRAQAAA